MTEPNIIQVVADKIGKTESETWRLISDGVLSIAGGLKSDMYIRIGRKD